MITALIGCGNMGGAFARAFVASGFVAGENLLLVDRSGERRHALARELNAMEADSLEDFEGDVGEIILAVKPQSAAEVFPSVAARSATAPIVTSIMAGVTLARLIEAAGHDRVIRAMPNLPVQVGKGVSVAIAGAGVRATERERAETLLGAVGVCIFVSDERLLDAATAVSGSGPGFVFYLLEHFVKVTQELGFSAEQAALLVRQTISGSLDLWQQTGKSASRLREEVTSKGGTTEAGLRQFGNELGQLFEAGVRAAYDRSIELGEPKRR